MPIQRVSLNFAQLSDSRLGDITTTVATKMANNPSYTTPAIDPAALTAANVVFLTALAAAAQGGTQLTAAKNAARANVLELLRTQAAYVQSAAQNDLTIMLSSGFEVIKTDRTRRPLEKPAITNIDNFASTQLMVTMPPVDNARSYEFRRRVGSADWVSAGVFTKSTGVLLDDLIPGATYDLQGRAVGGTTGYSDWSDPVSRMAT